MPGISGRCGLTPETANAVAGQSCAGDDGEIDAADHVVIAVNASMIRKALAA